MATICKDVQEWIKEQVWKPVDDWVRRTEENCKKRPWWHPLRWFCWLVTIVVKIVRWVLAPVLTLVFRIVCEVVNFFVNLVAAIFNIILTFPIIGPIIKAIIRAVTTAISYVVGLADGLAGLVGIRITKHLRVHVIPLCEGIIPLAYETHLTPIMRETERIFYARAKIRVHTRFHEPVRNPPENALRLGTEFDLVLDEAWLKGTWHQMQTVKLFESNVWSLIGIGHPIIVYVVREVGYDGQGKVAGTSGGPFTDWIAVERDAVISQVVTGTGGVSGTPLLPYPPTVASSPAVTGMPNPFYAPRLIAHEICHSLGLLGHENSNPGELMVPDNITGDALSPFQVGIIRSSGHVTFF